MSLAVQKSLNLIQREKIQRANAISLDVKFCEKISNSEFSNKLKALSI